jgi:hypothetical protein
MMLKEKRVMKNHAASKQTQKDVEKILRSNLPKLQERLANLKEARHVSQDLLKLEVSF